MVAEWLDRRVQGGAAALVAWENRRVTARASLAVWLSVAAATVTGCSGGNSTTASPMPSEAEAVALAQSALIDHDVRCEEVASPEFFALAYRGYPEEEAVDLCNWELAKDSRRYGSANLLTATAREDGTYGLIMSASGHGLGEQTLSIELEPVDGELRVTSIGNFKPPAALVHRARAAVEHQFEKNDRNMPDAITPCAIREATKRASFGLLPALSGGHRDLDLYSSAIALCFNRQA